MAESIAPLGRAHSPEILQPANCLTTPSAALFAPEQRWRMRPAACAELSRLSLLATVGSALTKATGHRPTDVNSPSPEIFATAIDAAWQAVNGPELRSLCPSDPYAAALLTQLQCTLKHVRLTFSMKTEAYIHDYVLQGPYAFEPSRLTLEATRDLLEVFDAAPATQARHIDAETFATQTAHLAQSHKNAVETMLKNPLVAYENFRARLAAQGPEAPFPEFADLAHFLALHVQKQTIGEAAQTSGVLSGLRDIVLADLAAVEQERFPYTKTVNVLEKVVGFLDVFERGKTGNKTSPLYHSHRYQYYTHYLKAQTPDHIMLPIFHDIGATALLQMRGVPISMIGAHPETTWVDGYWQSPQEFWFHDINHSRRMFQFFSEHAQNTGVTRAELARRSNAFIQNEVLPLMAIKKADTPREKNEKRLNKMVFFEMFHEDALPGVKSAVEGSLLRAPNTLTPFENLVDDEARVAYTMEPGATTLAYVYRKLAGNFYDLPGERMEWICGASFRTQKDVAASAVLIAAKLGLNVPAHLATAYAYDDTGLPDDFRLQVERQMAEDPTLMVPLSTRTAVSE